MSFGFGALPQMQLRPEDLQRLFDPQMLGLPQGFSGTSGTLAPSVPLALDEAQTQALERQTGMVPQAPRPLSFGKLPSLEGTGSADASARAGSVGAPVTAQPIGIGQPSTQADMPAPGAVAAAASYAPPASTPGLLASAAPASSFADRWKALADTGIGNDMLAMGAGLLSGRGAAGWSAGFSNLQANRRAQALTDQYKLKSALDLRKLQQEAGGRQSQVELLVANGTPRATAEQFVASAAAGNDVALNNALGRISPKAVDAPSGYSFNADGSASYIPGGPQDPRTMEAESLAKARGAAAGKPVEDRVMSPGQVLVSGDTNRAIVSVPDRSKAMEQSSSIRKEIQGLPSYKNYTSALPTYQSMKEAAGRDSKASDLNLIYGLGKIFDPTSVVREGELHMAQDTQGVGDRLNGLINGIMGGARLSKEARQQLLTEAFGRVQSYENAFGQDRKGYEGIVDRHGFNADDVLPNFAPVTPYAPPTEQGGAPAPGSPAAPQTAAPAQTAPRSKGDANARFQQLQRSGMPKAQIFQKMRDEGF